MARKTPGSIRLIAGRWRGRKLPVPDLPGLRPSGDRGRETLFNWLQPWVDGAVCLDLFAGSGALGFEAASRGATHVDLVEIAPLAVSSMVESAAMLNARQVEVHRSNALSFLGDVPQGRYDLVFLDPPFDSGLAIQAMTRIVDSDCVKDGGFVYVEMPAQLPELHMQPPFGLHKEKVLGEVRMRLFRKK
jgi:16S rRNA (guanine966-N2)-methyltransferase